MKAHKNGGIPFLRREERINCDGLRFLGDPLPILSIGLAIFRPSMLSPSRPVIHPRIHHALIQTAP